jgi:site-specific DNA recombinase
MNTTHYTSRKSAVIYVRVSTKEQVDEGNSLSTQEKICRDYANRCEYEIADIFVEQGESAKTADRTQLQKLLAYCADKKHGINAVIIYKLDRLSRNTDDYSQLRLLLKRYGVEIKSTSEHFENNPVGRFMENTMANIAQFDNDIRAERCSGGMKDAMRDGRYVWMAPIGYNNVKPGGRATIAQNDRMGPIIRQAFELIAINVHSTEDVRKKMTNKVLLNKKARPLSKGYFYKLLTNQVYAGWIIKFGEKHRGTFQPIVSDELFDQVQRVLKYKGRKHSQYITDHPDFPLRKFILNNNGKKLTGSWSKGRYRKYPFYRFGGNESNYNRDKFERMYMDFVEKFRFDDSNLKRLKELVKANLVNATLDKRKEADRLKKHINMLSEKQTGIIKKNLDGVIPDNVLKQQLNIIERELTEAHASLLCFPEVEIDFLGALAFVEDYLKSPGKIWRNAKLGVQIKLQWFQFPSGLVFENNFFGTTEMSRFFKVKMLFDDAKSSKVDPRRFELLTFALQKHCSTS